VDNWTDWKNQGTYTPFCGDLIRDLLAENIREENTFDLTLPRLVFAARSYHLVSSQFSPPGSTSVHTQKTIVYIGRLGACSRASVVRHDTKAVGPGKLDCLTELSLEPIYEANSHT